jgi:hypothetical protein
MQKRQLIYGGNSEIDSCSIATNMHFDLQNLIQDQDLQRMEAPFTKEDIDKIISSMLADKAPGPDNFNGIFFKKC